MSGQEGLEWVNTTFGLEPRWTKEPDIDIIRKIARKHLGDDVKSPINVTFHAQGAFNKLYKIEKVDSACLLRVSLPVYPHLKTQSEVATINFVRDHIGMPAPRIIAFDSESHNDLGFEWILMELMPGDTLRKRWRKMSWNAKEDIVKQLARYQARLKSKPFSKIGNLFPSAEGSSSPVLGPIVSLIFFWGDHLTHNVPRGPFKDSCEWLQTRLKLAITDQDRLIKTLDDEDDLEDAEFAKELAEEIAGELLKVFTHEAEERTMLFHDDLSMQNILVDEQGELTAVIDWECVSAVPEWRACQYPQLLEGRIRDEEPSRADYTADSDSEEHGAMDALDNEGINTLYWEHKLEYEQTQLRKIFTEEMTELIPDWLAVFKSSTLQADFEKAVHNCDNTWRFKVVRRWLEAYKEGNIESLTDKLLE